MKCQAVHCSCEKCDAVRSRSRAFVNDAIETLDRRIARLRSLAEGYRARARRYAAAQTFCHETGVK